MPGQHLRRGEVGQDAVGQFTGDAQVFGAIVATSSGTGGCAPARATAWGCTCGTCGRFTDRVPDARNRLISRTVTGSWSHRSFGINKSIIRQNGPWLLGATSRERAVTSSVKQSPSTAHSASRRLRLPSAGGQKREPATPGAALAIVACGAIGYTPAGGRTMNVLLSAGAFRSVGTRRCERVLSGYEDRSVVSALIMRARAFKASLDPLIPPLRKARRDIGFPAAASLLAMRRA